MKIYKTISCIVGFFFYNVGILSLMVNCFDGSLLADYAFVLCMLGYAIEVHLAYHLIRNRKTC